MTLNKKKYLFITAGVIALVVLAVSLSLLLNIKKFKPRIEAAVSSVLEMDFLIKGRMGISFYPGFGISLKDVSLQKGGSDVATIEKITIGLKLLPLVKSQIRITHVGIIKPVLSIVRYKNGMFNFETQGDSALKMLISVKELSVSQGSLVLTDETSAGKIEANDFDLSIKNFLSNGTASADHLRNISFTGDARVRTLKIYDFTLMDLVMRAAGEKGILEINPVSVNILGGTGAGSIHLDVTGLSPRYRITCILNRVRMENLLQQFSSEKISQKAMEGMINFSADLTATGKNADEVKRSLNGNISLNGEDLMFYDMDIDALIMKYERSQNFNLVDVGAFALAGPFGPLFTKSFNFVRLYEESQGGKGVIRKLVSVWKVKNGIAEAVDVALASKKHRIAMKGGLNFINEQFLDITVAALDKRGCAVFSEKIHGPFSKPQIEKENIFKSISGSLLNPLKDAWNFIQGEECVVFYSGSVAHPDE
jgi:uncharacterized protein involved in outer membrane biogenesis